ncbi:hypothetical protein [Paenibacillus endoradicis]|uniref:hypothetical protein n=1 Tax=Paenibacillus endoradicis TaxID=2972487 RepID=UPI00215949A2|nr:hypothetical protein [Paenibacillus endoradicis]MCR8659401.1 hypothetical protein [Paenibacillus endoradicis]
MAKNNNKQFAKSNIPQGTPQSMTPDTEFSQEINANTNNEQQSLSKQSNKKHKN